MLCAMVFVVALVVSNIIAAKTVSTGMVIFGTNVIVPCAVICYFLTFLMTDVVGEVWGKEQAQQIVKWGFACQVIACALVALAQFLPASSQEMQTAYDMLLGQNIVFVIASLFAYLASQTCDVLIFHGLRSRFIEKDKGVKWRWVWNNVSTMTSQAIDTVIYITIAFGLGMGWVGDPSMVSVLLAMMLGQYLCKVVLAALDTPVFYLLTRSRRSDGGALAEDRTAA